MHLNRPEMQNLLIWWYVPERPLQMISDDLKEFKEI